MPPLSSVGYSAPTSGARPVSESFQAANSWIRPGDSRAEILTNIITIKEKIVQKIEDLILKDEIPTSTETPIAAVKNPEISPIMSENSNEDDVVVEKPDTPDLNANNDKAPQGEVEESEEDDEVNDESSNTGAPENSSNQAPLMEPKDNAGSEKQNDLVAQDEISNTPSTPKIQVPELSESVSIKADPTPTESSIVLEVGKDTKAVSSEDKVENLTEKSDADTNSEILERMKKLESEESPVVVDTIDVIVTDDELVSSNEIMDEARSGKMIQKISEIKDDEADIAGTPSTEPQKSEIGIGSS